MCAYLSAGVRTHAMKWWNFLCRLEQKKTARIRRNGEKLTESYTHTQSERMSEREREREEEDRWTGALKGMNGGRKNGMHSFQELTLYNELSIPPANDIFFHVIMTTCFGLNVSAPTTPSRISHLTRSRTSTPNRSVRVCKSRSCLQHDNVPREKCFFSQFPLFHAPQRCNCNDFRFSCSFSRCDPISDAATKNPWAAAAVAATVKTARFENWWEFWCRLMMFVLVQIWKHPMANDDEPITACM